MIVIRKISTGIFTHEIEGKLIISMDRDLAVINNTVVYSSNEISASEKIENVKIYDLEGNSFTFVTGQDLVNKLYELGYFAKKSNETDPVFSAWLNTNPLGSFLTTETDPVFTAWLNTNPLGSFLTAETDPVFSAWLNTNPLGSFLTAETDPVFSAWLQNASFIPYTGATSNVDLGAHTIALGNEEVNTNYSKHVIGVKVKTSAGDYPIYRFQSHYWTGATFLATNNNIGFGIGALKNNKASYDVTAFGNNSLENNLGISTTAVGSNAGRYNTGENSSFFGALSGYYNTAPLTAFGDHSGMYNTGYHATFIGHYAGTNNTAQYSFGAGMYSLRNNIGYNSIGVGYAAGEENKGRELISIGSDSGVYNIGENSIGIGSFSIRKNIGYRAIGIGYAALIQNTKGPVVALGDNAGKYNGGYRNVYIGDDTGIFLENSVASKKILDNYNNINYTNNRITIANHGFGSIGSYINLKYSNLYGYNIIGLQSGEIYLFKIIDINTIELLYDYLMEDYQGLMFMDEHTFTPQYIYNNTSCVGYQATATKSNQVVIGNSSVTEVLIGSNLAIDKTSIVNAASGTPLYVRLINGVKTITI